MATTPDPVDSKVSQLATKALAVKNAGMWSKLIAGALVALWTWYLKSELSSRNDELAKARTELANEKMDAQQAFIKAQSKVLSDRENLALQQAQADLASVKAKEAALKAIEDEHATRIERVQKLKNWSELDALVASSK